ncbi:MAG: hypothetical protein Q9222_005180 [Ikaeria aurantiellina]
MPSGPYLILWCSNDEIPSPLSRPFTIADSIATYLQGSDASLPEELLRGNLADGEDIEIDESLVQEFQCYRLPSVATLRELGRSFVRAGFVTYYMTGIIVELPMQSIDANLDTLDRMPHSIQNSTITLQYHNGPLASALPSKSETPCPPRDALDPTKTYLSSTDILMADEFVLDNNTKQNFKCLGIRMKVPLPQAADAPSLVQMLYATSPPLIAHSDTQTTAALVRSRQMRGEGDIPPQGEEIAGFMELSAEVSVGEGKLVYFVEALDELIEV